MRYVSHSLVIGEVRAVDLIARFGSPLYVYDAAVIERQIDRLKKALPAVIEPAYALKANSNLSILQLIARRGLRFDAVSPGEIFLLSRCGLRGERIWFTCSNVSKEDFDQVNDPELIINLNGMSELDLFLASGLRNPISLRINPEIGAGHHRDVVTGGFGVKFGFDPAELMEAVKIARDAGHRLEGLHAHIGSGVSEVAPLVDEAKRLIAFATEIGELRWLNFGGGFGTPYHPLEQEFPIGEYGEALRDTAESLLREHGMTGIVEPGRYIVAQSGVLLTTVTAKRISDGYHWLGCDTGFNHLARPSKYGAYHHVLNATRGSDADLRENASRDVERGESVLAGNICESGDVFTRSSEGIAPRQLPHAKVGDVLALCDTGAYGFSMASHYNARQLPAEVLVRGAEATLIRERQTFEELLRGQILCD